MLKISRRQLLVGAAIALVVAAGAFGVKWMNHRATHLGDAQSSPPYVAPFIDPLATLSQEDVLKQGIPPDVPLPWEGDRAFIDAVSQHQTLLRLAAFRAVIPHPYDTERANIALAAETLSGTVVGPGDVFSQNATLGPYTADRGYKPGPNYIGGRIVMDTGGGVCKISSSLYNLTILSDLPVVTRRAHSMTVPYVPPGQDATVTYSGGQDYRFKNDTDGPLLIWSTMVDNALYMAFYGTAPAPSVLWEHEVLSRSEPTTQVRHNPALQPGEMRVIFEGFEAITVRSRAVITDETGERRVRDLGVSTYQMAPRIVERG